MRDIDRGRIEFVPRKRLPEVMTGVITHIGREDHDFQKFEITLDDGTIVRLMPSFDDTVSRLETGDELIIREYEGPRLKGGKIRTLIDDRARRVVLMRENRFVTSFHTNSTSIERS